MLCCQHNYSVDEVAKEKPEKNRHQTLAIKQDCSEPLQFGSSLKCTGSSLLKEHEENFAGTLVTFSSRCPPWCNVNLRTQKPVASVRVLRRQDWVRWNENKERFAEHLVRWQCCSGSSKEAGNTLVSSLYKLFTFFLVTLISKWEWFQ